MYDANSKTNSYGGNEPVRGLDAQYSRPSGPTIERPHMSGVTSIIVSGTSSAMETIILLLLIAGAVFFALGAFGVAARINWTPLGLLCWILTALIGALQ